MTDPEHSNPDATSIDEQRVRAVGLLVSPGFSERLAEDLLRTLPEALQRAIDSTLEWKIEIVVDPLTGSNVAISDVLVEIAEKKARYQWDYAISLTDLPIRQDDRIILARTGGGLDVAVISLPPLGTFGVRRKAQKMILEVMDDLYRGTISEDASSRFVKESDATRGYVDEDEERNLRYTAPPLKGHIYLLTGMVYANRPWRLFPSFKTTVATAFATGGYGLIFTTLWEIGNAYGYGRLITLMIVAMSFLVGWIILSHRLWEPKDRDISGYLRSLYNAATLLTIATGVVFYYAVIFVLLLVAAIIYIPTGMLETTIGQEVTPINYVRIAWVTSSVATIAGAIGAGLEDSEAVQNATFGWRQSNRWRQHQQEQEQEDEGE